MERISAIGRRPFGVAFLSSAVAFLMVSVGGAGSIDATWTDPVKLTDVPLVYFDSDISLGRGNDIYAVSWGYDSGPVLLFRSHDGGKTWNASNVFGQGIFRGEPGMCMYQNGAADELLISTAGSLYKSTDGGDSFSYLSTLPLSSGALWWRFMEVGTNASWFGGVADSDVYMVGSQAIGIPWSDGEYVVSFVKSSDGGLTWSQPVIVCDTDRTTQFAELICDGERLFVFYTAALPGYEYTDLYVRSSDDWGMTWSEEKVVIPNRASQWVSPHATQHLGDGRALLTVADLVTEDDMQSGLERIGRYGYFNYADMTFQEVGNVSGDDWGAFGAAFSGALSKNGKLHLVWMRTTTIPTGNLWYTSCIDSGLVY